MNTARSRFVVLPRQRSRRWPWVLLLALCWSLSTWATWRASAQRSAPALTTTAALLELAEADLAGQQSLVRQLTQREATLSRSDQISREANRDLQGSLAERDEEITALRADVAFYERLVGPTQQRKGLNVFSSQFSAVEDSAWSYQIVLTQNLNRGAISQGHMRFMVEGVRDGKLATVGWDELHQKTGSSGQPFSFRYFQELEGRVMLPRDFTPQRVRVRLDGGEAAIEQAFDWKTGST